MGWAVMVGVLAVWSLRWRPWHDAAFVQYVSWLIDRGYRPYADVFDIQLPGTYLVYVAGQRIFGLGDLGFATFNLCWLGLTCVAVWRCIRTLGRLPAIIAVLMLATLYLLGAPRQTMQRDWLMVLPIAVAFAEVFHPKPVWARTTWAGVMIGFATLIKPQAIILGPIFAVFLCLRLSGWPRRASAVTGLTAGLAVPPFLAAAWLWRVGSLDAFVWTWSHYIPLYAQLNGSGVERAAGLLPYLQSSVQTLEKLAAPKYLLVTLGTMAAVWAAVWRPRSDREERLRVEGLLAWLLYGLVHVVSAGKGFTYHFWPFFSAAIALMALLCAFPYAPQDGPSLPASRRGTWLARVTRLAPSAFAAFGMGVIVLRMLGVGGPDALVGRNLSEMDELALALESRARPGDRVQVLDTTGGAAHAAYIARMEPGSRFVDDFHFFHHEGTRTNAMLRGRLVQDLRRTRPRFVAVWGASWAHRGSFRDLDRFTELSNTLHDDYVIAIDRAAYRLYERKPGI